jgi:hypothetical protein
MAKSAFFNKSSPSEIQLYTDIIGESLKIMGENILYLPRQIVDFDQLFGEDILSKYPESFLLEAYQDHQDVGFGESTNLFTKFGITTKTEATYIISKSSFEQIVLNNNLEGVQRPSEGDLVYNMMSSQLFQIRFVEEELPYRQFGAIITYKLYTEAYKYSNNVVRADIVEPEINKVSTAMTLTLLSGIGDFQIGEIIQIGNTINVSLIITAKVVDWNLPLKQLKIIDISDDISTVGINSVIGQTANWIISEFSTVNDSNKEFDLNEFLQTRSDTILDKSKTNVLGEIITDNFMENF